LVATEDLKLEANDVCRRASFAAAISSRMRGSGSVW